MHTVGTAINEKPGISWDDWQERNRLQDLRGVALRAKLTKYVSIAVLLLALVFWGRAADYQVFLAFVVCAGAVRVAFQAAAMGKYDWAVLFIGTALLYNPVFPPFALTGHAAFLLVIASITAFAASLFLMKPRLAAPVAGR
jgi:hypothetical protein